MLTTNQKGTVAELAVALAASKLGVGVCAEVDAITAYSGDLDPCLLVPMTVIERHRELRLRLVPARNNQRKGIRWVDDFDFAAKIQDLSGP